jgi:hypothetical protein
MAQTVLVYTVPHAVSKEEVSYSFYISVTLDDDMADGSARPH